MKKPVALAAIGMALTACAYPHSSIEQGRAPGRFVVVDAPAGASILIDGRVVGTRSAEKSDSFLAEPGTHQVEERFQGRVLLRRPYSIDPGATIEVKG